MLKRVAPCLLPLLISTALPLSAASRQTAATAQDPVAKKALQIVSEIHGTWNKMPGDIATGLMTKGALLGNGSVGVAIGGTPEKQQFYLGRNDFWSVQRGKIMPVGQLQLAVPALAGASAQLQENIASGNVTAAFTTEQAKLNSRAWVDANHNIFYLQLENRHGTALQAQLRMLDGFGQDDQQTLGGTTGQVFWRKISPELVHATIGSANDAKGPLLDAEVRSLQIFNSATASSAPQQTPQYAWSAATSLLTANSNTPAKPFSCGNLIFPEQQFTLRTSLRADQATSGVIFSSVTQQWMQQQQDSTNPLGNVRGHDTGRPQGAQAGLLLYLTEGRLAANLNGTVVIADRPIPLHQWTDLAATYDGTTLRLLANGEQIAATTNFPNTAQVMGPAWEWAASHPGDRQLPFAGIAPQGVLALRVLGAQASESAGALSFQIPANGKIIIAAAIIDDRDTADYLHTAISDLQQTTAATIATAWRKHQAWWQTFWSRSYVELPDKTVQAWWYGSLYVLASCSRHGNVAPGLWGNWITSPDMGWQGDYTLDYNYQAPFWAAFPTNHVELADVYDAPLLAWMQRGSALAHELHAHGLVYYTHLAPSPGWSSDNFRALDQKSDALFAAVNCIQRWRYTRDLNYARTVWPFLTGVADFWDHDLTLQNGRYVDLEDAEDEHLWGPAHDKNPAAVIGFLHMLYPALLDMSEQLHTGESSRDTWKNILANLSPLPVVPAETVPAIVAAVNAPLTGHPMVIAESEQGMQWVDISHGDRFSSNPPVFMTGSSAGMNSLQAVFPAWNVGLESSEKLQQAAKNTVDYSRLWYDNNNTSNFYPAAADAGYDPASILEHLHLLVTHLGYPSFAYQFPAGGIENEATVPTTIASMFLQSYQRNIHVFPNWPADQNASFGHLLAVGDFLVSSSMRNGVVQAITIKSLRGGTCHLANPWRNGKTPQLKRANQPKMNLHGSELSFPTHAGETLVLTAS